MTKAQFRGSSAFAGFGMDAGNELIEKFVIYRKSGLLTEEEFCQVTESLLGDTDYIDPWVGKLEDACALASSGKLDQNDFLALKKRILAQAGGQDGSLYAKTGEEADKIIRICVGAACLVGLFPLRMADAPFLIIIQYIMLRKLCEKYGRTPGYSLVLIVFAALLGPLIFNAFIKVIPMAGSLFGALVAGSFTWFIGVKVKSMLARGMPFTLRNFISAPVRRAGQQKNGM